MSFDDQRNRINALICTNFYLRLGSSQIGGVERLSLILISTLRKKGCRFFNAFRTTDDNSKDDELDEHYFLESERIKITDRLSCDELAGFLTRNNINVIHIQQAETRDFLLYREAAERVGAVVIATMHKKPFEDLFTFERSYIIRELCNSRFSKKIGILKKLFLSSIIRRKRLDQIYMKTLNTISLCHRIVILSQNYIPGYASLLQKDMSSSDTDCIFSIIPNCVSFSNYFPEIHIPRLKQKEILVVGRLDDTSRRISILINMWSELSKSFPDWTLRILGDGPSAARYKKSAASAPSIKIEGRQDPESYYRTASIYVNLSITDDAWSMSLLEAMQYALIPVVFNTSESYSDIIEHEQSGFILEDMSVTALKHTLQKLMNDEKLRHTVARNSLARSKMFSQLTYCYRYHNLYVQTHKES